MVFELLIIYSLDYHHLERFRYYYERKRIQYKYFFFNIIKNE